MKLVGNTYQMVFFSDNSDIQQNTRMLKDILEAMESFDVMPTFGYDFNSMSGEKKKFLVLQSVDENLVIEFHFKRISINYTGGSAYNFKQKSYSIMEEISKLYPGKLANRISFVQSRLFYGDDTEYDTLYKRLFTYKKEVPFEWDNRIALRKTLGSEVGDINSISTIRRCVVSAPFINKGADSDIILSEIDVNTVPKNTTTRYAIEDVRGFYNELFDESEKNVSLLKRYF